MGPQGACRTLRRHLLPTYRRYSILAALLLSAVVFVAAGQISAGGANSHAVARIDRPQTAQRHQTAARAAVTYLRHKIDRERQATWRWQDHAQVPRTATAYSEKHASSVGYLRWVARLWTARRYRARHYIRHLTAYRGYLSPHRARQLGRVMAAQHGWTGQQWDCLDQLWGTRGGRTLESGWDVRADNPTSPAYGIPQADPGSKMASAGRRWLQSAYVQIEWGLRYIKTNAHFHNPCEALAYRLANGSY